MAKKFDKERKLHKKHQDFMDFCRNCTNTRLTAGKSYVSIKARLVQGDEEFPEDEGERKESI